MVKKKTSKATKHLHDEKVVHRDVASRSSDESPLIEMNQSTILTGVIFLLVGLIIGALVVSAISGGITNPIDNSTCDVDFPVDALATKEKIENYLNTNLRQSDMITQGLSFSLEDSNDLSSTTKGYEVYVGDGSGLTQPAGAIIYVDGDNFVIAQSYPININDASPLEENNEETTTNEFAKTETPKVDLFIMSFCPYGLSAADAYKEAMVTFSDKADIDLGMVIYSDLATNYGADWSEFCLTEDQTYCSLHGIEELKEDVRQLCIQKYENDKLWDYMDQLIADYQVGLVSTSNIKDKWETYASNAGISIDTINNCVENETVTLLEEQLALNSKYGVRGSPTVIINEGEYTGARSSSALGSAICSAFINAPEECGVSLSNETVNTTGQC